MFRLSIDSLHNTESLQNVHILKERVTRIREESKLLRHTEMVKDVLVKSTFALEWIRLDVGYGYPDKNEHVRDLWTLKTHVFSVQFIFMESRFNPFNSLKTAWHDGVHIRAAFVSQQDFYGVFWNDWNAQRDRTQNETLWFIDKRG